LAVLPVDLRVFGELVTSRAIPWWAKIAGKIVLSRLPLAYGGWQRFGLFRHGRMDDHDYALQVFRSHVNRTGLAGKIRGRTIVELGPGDSIATAVVAAAHEARSILVDTGSFAHSDVRRYIELAQRLAAGGLQYLDLKKCQSREQLLQICNGRYLTNGLQGLRELPESSVDLIFSQAVLEHVRKADFSKILAECRRILKPDGVFSNDIDLQDHLGGALNHLRFPEWLWESNFLSASGFYTNRLRYGELLSKFRDAGFTVEVISRSTWECLPTPLHAMQEEFRSLPYEDLRVLAFSVVLR
jgi:SAM-dependent methyltransferase